MDLAALPAATGGRRTPEVSHEATGSMQALEQAALECANETHAQAMACDTMTPIHSAGWAYAARAKRVADDKKKVRG